MDKVLIVLLVIGIVFGGLVIHALGELGAWII